MRAYEYRHVVGFEDTNLVGNVYYTAHLSWQGRCREMFLAEHASDVLSDLARGLALVTIKVSCDYYRELGAFDEVVLRMHAVSLTQNRVTMSFDYFRVSASGEELIAKGEQQIACMKRQGETLVATPWPITLRDALRSFMTTLER